MVGKVLTSECILCLILRLYTRVAQKVFNIHLREFLRAVNIALPFRYSKVMFLQVHQKRYRLCRSLPAYANKANIVNKDSSILYYLLKRKASKSRFSGIINFDKQQHYNIRNVQDSAFCPQGSIYDPLSPGGHDKK